MAGLAGPLTSHVAWAAIRAACRQAIGQVDLRVEGLASLPPRGPALIAARHFHHLYDGCALLTVAPRPMRLMVTLDWVSNPAGRWVMMGACRVAGWPVVPRSAANGADGAAGGRGGHAQVGAWRSAVRESVRLLRAGRLLLVFPEGYPTIDPGYTPKRGDDAFLPFRPGFLRIAAMAEGDGQTRAPIVPVGLEYRRGARWQVTVRFGEPVTFDRTGDFAAQARAVEERVRVLSGLAEPRRHG